MDKPYLKRDADDLLLRLVLQPKASRDAFVGLLGDELKVAITAPPVDGQANKHLIKFLSKQFKVTIPMLPQDALSGASSNIRARHNMSELLFTFRLL